MIFSLKQLSVFLLIAVFLFGTAPVNTDAQVASVSDGRLSLSLSPRIPGPDTQVTARVENYTIDIQRAPISWSTSDGQKLQGIGESYFTFTTTKTGIRQQITVSVTTPSGTVLTETMSITPASIDLLVEADTYTPPFYKGRSLFTHQSSVTVSAIPEILSNGTSLNPNNLLFTWEKNNKVIQQASGVGKSSISFVGSVVSQPFSVTVTAESLTSGVVARKQITVEPHTPQVVIYENNPVYGSVFEKAVANTFLFDREEVGLTAIPYFFSVNTRSDGNLLYTWMENDTELKDPALGSDLTFTNKGLAVRGMSNIFVRTSHLNSTLQNARMNFMLDIVGNETLETQIQQGNVTVF
jgi:hypothetical protein